MSIEIVVLISVLSFVLTVIVNVGNMRRGDKQDTKSDTTQLTTVIVKLENISAGISEIKADMNNVKADLVELRERLVKAESSTASAHKRLDEQKQQ